MSKEEILSKWGLLNDSLVTWQKEDVYKCMQEFTDQEKEKVAVAFAEWKDRYVDKDINGFYFIINDISPIARFNLHTLYQYFIQNVYNK